MSRSLIFSLAVALVLLVAIGDAYHLTKQSLFASTSHRQTLQRVTTGTRMQMRSDEQMQVQSPREQYASKGRALVQSALVFLSGSAAAVGLAAQTASPAYAAFDPEVFSRDQKPDRADQAQILNGALPDYKKVRADIEEIIAAVPDKGPTLVRLAWHSSGTYDKISKTGGSNGGTIRFKEELSHGANAGLDNAVAWLDPVYKKYNKATDLSYADLYTLAGVVAIQKMGGPVIPWRAGRSDAPDATKVTPDGRLPDADKGGLERTGSHLRQIFGRMGFNDQEIVALSGAHALGRCHPTASGYVGM
jgi:Peroxidase